VAEAAALSLHRLAERRRSVDLEVLRERQRIACALHDSVAQMLFAIGVSAQQSLSVRDPDVLAKALSEIEITAAGARAELRDVFARLSEPLPGLALDAVLEAEARLFRHQTACHVVVTGDGEPRVLTDLAQALIVDVAREGLRNASKHGGARIAVVHVGYEQHRVVLTVQAEGERDFTALAGSPTTFAAGSGLGILQRRSEQLGGGLGLTFGEHGAAVLRLELS
jgi:signal transduction histidine kinase